MPRCKSCNGFWADKSKPCPHCVFEVELDTFDPWMAEFGPRRMHQTKQEEWALVAIFTLLELDVPGAGEDGQGPSRVDRPRLHYFKAWAGRGFTDTQWKQAIEICKYYHRQVGRCPEN